jgi:hypothetical protein
MAETRPQHGGRVSGRGAGRVGPAACKACAAAFEEAAALVRTDRSEADRRGGTFVRMSSPPRHTGRAAPCVPPFFFSAR